VWNYISTFHLNSKVEVSCTLVQALRLCTGHTAHRGSRGIALLFMTMALEGGEGSASRPARSLPPGKTWYSLYRRLGGPQGRPGQVRKISPSTGIRFPDRPACSQSLYRLRYPAHTTLTVWYLIKYSIVDNKEVLISWRWQSMKIYSWW